ARVELGDGIHASCRIDVASPAAENNQTTGSPSSKPDLSSLGSMLQARWKGVTPGGKAKSEPIHAGQVRNFTITSLDAAAKKIELTLA
ncbi:MAG: 30S ribosomal protein S1, partial [Candidatus Sulfotelmatobacter sp.]